MQLLKKAGDCGTVGNCPQMIDQVLIVIELIKVQGLVVTQYLA